MIDDYWCRLLWLKMIDAGHYDYVDHCTDDDWWCFNDKWWLTNDEILW